MAMAPTDPDAPLVKKPISFINLAIGGGLNMFEVSTLGQPFEVVKTTMAANRGDSMVQAIKKTWGRGGVFGFYQGLIPWAWIEASTKGAVLMFAASEIEYGCRVLGASVPVAGILGGMGGGIAQAYATMGFCTFMKTVEVTRHKSTGGPQKSTIQVAREIFAREGIRGINKGVNAVAVRQCTNWGSRFGLSRIAEDLIRKYSHTDSERDAKKPLSPMQKILASALGGGLSCWNQPIEVIRVEMQSQVKAVGRPENLTIGTAAKWIYKNNGLKGFYRGVTPRIGLGVWQTICMVFGGDQVKAYFANKK
ncbi:Mitochondrial DNA replication protein yhm2 [Borealophlyctis nickersoniae]|nr:Mitochondrial DNA replication protein yhm2 [Borealophlyctis nickersoniae]